MVTHRVELLAPAGNYDSFIGAINAGADAIYVGGERFSARAFADNFDTDTLCGCIKYAHLFGKRVYLTLNTLIKEAEFGDIYEYVKPFYLAGLDGVIIQDFGVLRFLKAHFPNMELHASTQMAVTGPEFVGMCKELGISRVVPARELALEELKLIRDAGIEVECFIHGAMCYCYSGMCLMSSILGGRSGNRGKCAQPCRLPYQITAANQSLKERYTLSLKDMCTMEHIPALIEAGMDSFKIEGRMKRSEYAAGVTALYRKYIDKYYQNPDAPFGISEEDRYVLEHLYMRSELQDGYLFKHNGREMVTKDAPSYQGLEEAILADIKQKYLGYTRKVNVFVYGYFEVGKESSLTISTADGISVTVCGGIVDAASNAPATRESISKQLSKLGNTHFSLEHMEISLLGDCFVPNGVLNGMRRAALDKLEQEIILHNFPQLSLREPVSDSYKAPEYEKPVSKEQGISVLVRTGKQLETLCAHSAFAFVEMLYLEDEAMDAYLRDTGLIKKETEVVYAMPYILRTKHTPAMKRYLQELYRAGVKQLLVRNVEELSLVWKGLDDISFQVITDASLYVWNRQAYQTFSEYASRVTLPFELNNKELRALRSGKTEQVIYGYIPLMVTANCIYKTNFNCQRSTGQTAHSVALKDRYDKEFSCLTNCKYCYNIIYNSVPLSLHKKYHKGSEGTIRLQFSLEDEASMQQILNFYENWIQDKNCEFPVKEYTTAHENRQVE